MSSRLINVRLDDQRLQRARRLRAEGIALSDLVREAIDRQYEQIIKSKTRKVEAIMAEIYEQFPDPPRLPRRNYNVHDRVQAKQAIRHKLRKK